MNKYQIIIADEPCEIIACIRNNIVFIMTVNCKVYTVDNGCIRILLFEHWQHACKSTANFKRRILFLNKKKISSLKTHIRNCYGENSRTLYVKKKFGEKNSCKVLVERSSALRHKWYNVFFSDFVAKESRFLKQICILKYSYVFPSSEFLSLAVKYRISRFFFLSLNCH